LEREPDRLGVITRSQEDIMTSMLQVVDDLSEQCNVGRIGYVDPDANRVSPLGRYFDLRVDPTSRCGGADKPDHSIITR
jgi:hypothetical protein